MAEHHVPTSGTPRRPLHWEIDLAEARSSEREIHQLFAAEPSITAVDDRSLTLAPMDFMVDVHGLTFGVEVKSKRQPYKAAARATPHIPERHQMILDEAHLRGAFFDGGIFVITIHDVPGGLWHLYSCWTVLLGEKHRWEREAHRQVDFRKAKVTIDLRNADLSAPTISARQIVDLAHRAHDGVGRTEAWHA